VAISPGDFTKSLEVNFNSTGTGTADSELDGTLVGVKQLDLGLGGDGNVSFINIIFVGTRVI
jgi:hypothetical protein